MNENKKTVLTYEGLKELEDELKILKTVKRKEIAERIKEARGQGDLSENAEYDSAKEEQGKIEARIVILEKMLRNAEIIDEDDVNKDVVGIGIKVRLFDEEFKEEIEYLIVGSAESNPANGKISDESPLGKALLGHAAEDAVEVEAPDGIVRYRVLGIA